MPTEESLNQSSSIVYRWLTHDENLRHQLQVLADDAGNNISTLAEEIEALIMDFHNPLTGHHSLYAELLQLAFETVNWQTIAATFLKENA